jgi:hypothetical protein
MYALLILFLFFILLFYLFSKKFSKKISEAFEQYKYTAVIIEPREHPALEFVLENFNENLSNDWQFVIFHGNKNIEYTENVVDKVLKTRKVKLVNLGVDNLSISDYSGLFYKSIIYDNIPTEIFLIFQTDTVICSKHKDLINEFLKYDYVGAPWINQDVGNGGLSLRRKSKMLEIVEKCKNTMDGDKYINEDVIFSKGCDLVDLYKPDFDKAKEFSIETVDNDKSFGIHKAYSYLDTDKIGKWCPEIIQLKKLN